MAQIKEPGLTAEVYALLNEHAELLEKPKGVWTAQEMAIIYAICNAYTGKNDKDTGCGSCRQSHVNKARMIYQEYKKTL